MSLAAADAGVVRRDPALPGLSLLLDPPALGRRLAERWPEAGIGGATGGYLRYKPATSCLAAFRLETTAGPVTGYAKCYRRDEEAKVAKARRRRAVPSRLGPARVVLDDQALVVCLFPNDDRVKSLRRLGEPELRARLLAEAVPDEPELASAELEPLAYKPDRRFVAALRTGERRWAVVKIYSPAAFARRSLPEARPRAGSGVRLARTLGGSARHRFEVLEWIPGRLLSGSMAAGGLDPATVAGVGGALHAFHRAPAPSLAGVAGEREAQKVMAVAKAVGWLCPAVAPRVLRLGDRIGERLARLAPGAHTVHGDFYAKQVVLSGSETAFLDLDTSSRGRPAADLANFLAHLERDAVGGRIAPGRFEVYAGALVEGYREAGGVFDEHELALLRAAALLHLAPQPFRSREPEWPDRTVELVERAERALRESIPSLTAV